MIRLLSPVIVLLCAAQQCWALDLSRSFPAAGVVRDQFVIVITPDATERLPAHASFKDGMVTVSAQLGEVAPEALVSVVIQFESGEMRSTILERVDRQTLDTDPVSIAEQGERDLERDIAALRSEQQELSARIEAANHDLRKRAGFDKVEEIHRAIAAVQAQIDALTAAK